MNWKYAGRIYEEDWWSQTFSSLELLKISCVNYGFALFHTDGHFLGNKNPLAFCYSYWPDMVGWEYIDSKYKTISPKGELKISGTRKLDWKGSDVRMIAS